MGYLLKNMKLICFGLASQLWLIPYQFFCSSGKPWKFGILYRSLNDSELAYTYQVP